MLRTISLRFSLVVLALGARAALADGGSSPDLRRDASDRGHTSAVSSTGSVAATPEMWFYEQERGRYEDPKQAVRRRAELRGQARQERLAALHWYGYSNSRPTLTTTPVFGSYSAHWGSNSYDPLRWRASQGPLVVLRPTSSAY